MNGPSQSRQLILDRIRAVTSRLANEPAVQVPRNYIRRGTLNRTGCIELMVKRLREYDAEVVETVVIAEAAVAVESAGPAAAVVIAGPGALAEGVVAADNRGRR